MGKEIEKSEGIFSDSAINYSQEIVKKSRYTDWIIALLIGVVGFSIYLFTGTSYKNIHSYDLYGCACAQNNEDKVGILDKEKSIMVDFTYKSCEPSGTGEIMLTNFNDEKFIFNSQTRNLKVK